MAQLQKVSWRTVGYTALGTALAAASIIAIVNRDGVRPTSLTSDSATRWLVDRLSHHVVLVDGLAGRVVAKIETGSEASDEVAVQGAGGAYLITPTEAAVRTISTAKLQLGTAQTVATLAEPDVKYGVGESGLTIVNSSTSEARVVAVNDVTRSIKIPKSNQARVAADGSMWLFSNTEATHVNVDESRTTSPVGFASQTTTIGSRAVTFDPNNREIRWIGGATVSIAALPNASEAVLQEPVDDAPCVWLGAGDTLVCVGPSAIKQTMVIAGLNISSSPGDRLAIAGDAAVVVGGNTNRVDRIDLINKRLAPQAERPQVSAAEPLTITATGNLVWLDDQPGESAWVVHRFGINTIDKNDLSAPVLNAQGQVQTNGDGGVGDASGNGNVQGDANVEHEDPHPGVEDPPVAVDDPVTARAGTTITIPVTGNDYDPDPGQAIAVESVGDQSSAGHGTTGVLNGTSVSYVPDPAYSGTDSFSYTIIDETGLTDTATVNVTLYPADSPNRPPIARVDTVKTRIDRPVTIDVLANDIDPERDLLTISTIGQNNTKALITDARGPTGLPALRYTPPPGVAGIFTFTYQAADPQGGTSDKTLVTVQVSDTNTENVPPQARPDSIRMRVGTTDELDVKANDSDNDGDDLTISVKTEATGVDAVVKGGVLAITMRPGALERSVIQYTLSDGILGHEQTGRVLVVRIPDAAANRPPVANPDAEKVVIGNSVKIPVIANDLDPDNDPIRLLLVEPLAANIGTTAVEGNFVRFTPNLPDITQPTPVTFWYRIGDGQGNEAKGTVTVTVLLEALPRAPFARDDFADTFTDKPVNIDVLANDGDPSGGTPSLRGDGSCPNGGTATKTDDQRLMFTPPAGFVGTIRCRYQVVNSQLLTAEASIIVTITAAPPGNRDPVVKQAVVPIDINIGQSKTFNVNDLASDPDGNSLVFSSVSKVTNGSTDFSQKSASFTYTAPPTGTADHTPTADTIDYIVSDGQDGNASGTISIRIIDQPTTPAASAPSVHLIERAATVGEPLPIDIFGELSDANFGIGLSLLSATPDTSSPSVSISLSGGVVTITPAASGSLFITYTVANADAPDQRASAKIHLTIADPPVSNPPPVAVDDELTVPSSGSGSVNLLANDTGITDPGDHVTVNVKNRPPASFGTITENNGVLTFNAARSSLGGTARLQYSVNDGTSTSADADIVITVLACSASPVSVRPGFEFTPYKTPINIDLTKYVDSGTIIPESVSGAGLSGPVGTYTPPDGMNGVEQVTYTVTNACGDEAQGVLTIDVNRAPIGGSIAQNLSPGDTLTLTVDQIASDDEALTINSLGGNPTWISIAQGAGAPGSFDQASIVASPPLNVPSGTYTFTATVADPGGLTAIASISLTINNQPPTAIADAYFTSLSQFTFDPTLNDFDSEPGPLAIQAVSVIDGPGTVLDVSSPLITVGLGHGVSTFSYTIRDSGGLTASASITVTSNHAPTVASVTDSTDQPTIDVVLLPTDPDDDPVSVDCPSSTPEFDNIVVILNPNPSNPAEVNRVRVHVNAAAGFQGTASFDCAATDSFGAQANPPATVTLTFTG